MFSRFFIPSPSQPNPYNDTGINVINFIDHVHRSASHSLMLDGILSSPERACKEIDPKNIRNVSPAMPGGEPSHKGFCKGIWSPYGLGERDRCLLTLVTHDHHVMIMARKGHDWVTEVDISALWHEKVSADSWKLVASSEDEEQIKVFTARMLILGISEILWTPIFHEGDKKFSIMIMITASGHAAFWKIPEGVKSSNEVTLLSIEETEMTKASAITWLADEEKSGHLLLGSSSGQVKIFHVKFAEEFLMSDLGYAFEEKDGIRVNEIRLLPFENKRHLLILGKEAILLALSIEIFTDEIVCHSTAHDHLGRLPISGLVCLENGNVYASLKDGHIQHLQVDLDGENVRIGRLDVPFKSEGVSHAGLVTSPHGTLWALLESVSVAFDHLAVREPSQISIYQVGNGEKILQHLNESKVPLHINVDLLESLRLYVFKTGEPTIHLIDPDNINSQTVSKAKLNLWLSKVCRNIRIGNRSNPNSPDETAAALEKYISEQWIITTIKKFTKEDLSSLKTLHLSLSLMCQWIIKNGRKDQKRIAQSLSKKLPSQDAEQCLICTANVPLDQLTSGTCENGHTLPRCCRTFLLTTPTIICSRCKVFSHKVAEDILQEKMVTCLYCDGCMVKLNRRQLQN